MNYITSCPACDTQFLLSNDHLKSHRGKVQCGNCEHIFNAKNRLTEISDDIHSPAEYNASLEAQAQVVAETDEEKPIGEVLNIILEGVPDLKDLESDYSEPTLAEVIQEPDESYIDEVVIESEIIEMYDTEQINAPITIEDLTAHSKFVRAKTKPNYWLMLLGLLLAILASLQTIYAMRTEIAAEYPQYKSYLVQACAMLKCNIPLPKNLDLLTIDDSDMQEDESHENVIKFSSLLINNAHYVQAYPDVELTLTDTSDQPVLRKLIKPSEYLQANINAASGIGARDEVRIKLAINVTDLTVAGYRVLLVY
jgi:predicted Zn finger-like uncharacterized protein